MAAVQGAVRIAHVLPDLRVPADSPPPLDLRFRTLLGEEAWAALPQPVRRRFSKFAGPEDTFRYCGRVELTELSWAGRLLALAARLIGGPIPETHGATGRAAVEVRADGSGGQSWTRIYDRPGRPPQTVRSAKRFRGPTGLEEYVGGGIGMALTLSVQDGVLKFTSDHYFLEAGRFRVRLPAMLAPGRMEIVHQNVSDHAFTFRLTLTHARLGRLVHQLVYFEEA